MNPGPTVDRFEFGKNWQSFAAIADEESVSEAQQGLIKLFQMERYEEHEFLM
jgi:hypothetical protein